MLFPIFLGIIANDTASTKPLAIKTAIELAAKLDAQLSVAVGALQISVPSLLTSGTVESLIATENRSASEQAMAASAQIITLANASGITIHTEVLKGDLPAIRQRFANRARVHGLVFAEAGKSGEFLGFNIIEPLLFESGRPVLIYPSDYSSRVSFDHVVIAWDGSQAAARAVWDAIPVLRLAKSIEIVTVAGEKELNDVAAANTLAPMLAYLGKKISVTVLTYEGGSAGDLIRDHAVQNGANLVVLGAYGRSRWRELVLGGVTRDMLQQTSIPIMMSH
jgi:nucleotide-binding universal stress UspA family protein